MNKLIPGSNSIATMTSLEIVDFINEDRKAKAEAAGAAFPSKEFPKLRHDSFMDKVPEVLKEAAPKFIGTAFYTNGTGAKVERAIYTFPKRESCLMAMSYSYDVQAKVFDRMTSLELQFAGLPAALIDGISDSVMTRIGGMVKSIVHKELSQTSGDVILAAQQAVNDAVAVGLPKAVNAYVALRQVSTRRGLTAGQVMSEHSLTKIKNGAQVLSAMLCKRECEIDGAGRAEMGSSTAKLFDPDKVRAQIKHCYLREQYETYVKERKGQLSLFKVVGKKGD